MSREVLDLFSAAAGGWSLGMHRAGYATIAACEAVDWRRTLYTENNPGVPIYDDVRTLTADRLLHDLGRLPRYVVGSPPCQDISSANTKGKGVEGERSGLYFEAVRIIGEVRPRWFALENSANLRTRGYDAVHAALEAIDYTCWAFVVRAGDVGANHERARSWLIGCDLGQVTNPDGDRRSDEEWWRRFGGDIRVSPYFADADETERWPNELTGSIGGGEACGRDQDSGKPRSLHWAGPAASPADASDAIAAGRDAPGRRCGRAQDAQRERLDGCDARNTSHPDQAGQVDGRMVAGLRQAKIAVDGCGDGRGADESGFGQMAVCANDRGRADGAWPLWSLDDLAHGISMDDGLPAWLAGTRIAVGGPRGTAAASLIVEAYGDAVIPQIPEAIGRAIQRVETALAAIYQPQRKAA